MGKEVGAIVVGEMVGRFVGIRVGEEVGMTTENTICYLIPG